MRRQLDLYTALPELRDQLATTVWQGIWAIDAYPLVRSGLLLCTGTLGVPLWGSRQATLARSFVDAGLVGSLAARFSVSVRVLITIRELLGVSAATSVLASLALG